MKKMKWLKRTKVNPSQNALTLYWGIKRIYFGKLGGPNIRLHPNSYWNIPKNIFIEDNVFISREAYIDAICPVKIASGTMIGPRCTMIAGNHNYKEKDINAIPYDNIMLDTPIVIERNVWIGANVTVCPGTHIGEGAIIGAGTSIHGIIPAFSIVVPADQRIVGLRDRKTYEELLKKDAIYNKKFAGEPFIIRKASNEKNKADY